MIRYLIDCVHTMYSAMYVHTCISLFISTHTFCKHKINDTLYISTLQLSLICSSAGLCISIIKDPKFQHQLLILQGTGAFNEMILGEKKLNFMYKTTITVGAKNSHTIRHRVNINCSFNYYSSGANYRRHTGTNNK